MTHASSAICCGAAQAVEGLCVRRKMRNKGGSTMSESSKTGLSNPDLFLPQPDALALEYQGEYGSAFRDLSIADIVNNPNASGVVRVFGPGFFEQATDLPLF